MSGAARSVVEFPAAEYAEKTAALLAPLIRVFAQTNGVCRIVLAGGRTPAAIYRALAALHAMPWEQVEVFIGDERCVPPSDPDSNYRMIAENLLSRVAIPSAQVHRLRGEAGATLAAQEYDAIVASLPAIKFDLVLSGVGADGHTASLFPADPTVATTTAWAAAATAPGQFAVAERVGLTMRALNATRVQVVLCTGAEKLPVRERILAEADDATALPAALLSGLDRTLWIIDPA